MLALTKALNLLPPEDHSECQWDSHWCNFGVMVKSLTKALLLKIQACLLTSLHLVLWVPWECQPSHKFQALLAWWTLIPTTVNLWTRTKTASPVEIPKKTATPVEAKTVLQTPKAPPPSPQANGMKLNWDLFLRANKLSFIWSIKLDLSKRRRILKPNTVKIKVETKTITAMLKLASLEPQIKLLSFST